MNSILAKTMQDREVLNLAELDALLREIVPAPAANDEEGGDGDAHLWAAYARLSGEWLSNHPTATCEEIEAARRHLAERLGL